MYESLHYESLHERFGACTECMGRRVAANGQVSAGVYREECVEPLFNRFSLWVKCFFIVRFERSHCRLRIFIADLYLLSILKGFFASS